MKSIRYYNSWLIESGAVHQRVKHSMNCVSNRIADFERLVNDSIGPNDHADWQKEWTERDFLVFSSVFRIMSDMNEEQRSVLEQVGLAIEKGEFHVELKEAS